MSEKVEKIKSMIYEEGMDLEDFIANDYQESEKCTKYCELGCTSKCEVSCKSGGK